jgi:hypothetical protein
MRGMKVEARRVSELEKRGSSRSFEDTDNRGL